MKKIKLNISLLLSIILSSGALISSCTKEDNIIIQKTLEERKLELKQFAAADTFLVNNTVLGYDKGNFRAASSGSFASYKTNYLNKLNAALVIADNPDATMKMVVDAYKSFGVPGQAFLRALNISDRRPLNDIYLTCSDLNTATLVGTTVGQVAQADKDTFTAAISRAKTWRDLSTTIERQVIDEVKLLTDAMTAFEAAIIK